MAKHSLVHHGIAALCMLASIHWFGGAHAVGQDSTDKDGESASSAFPNVRTPTMGGKQLWTDHFWRKGWRIQKHALTGHWRLLDAENIRHAWGTHAACMDTLNEFAIDNKLPTNKVLILAHGLGRSASSMNPLVKYFSTESDYTVVNFEYASTRASIEDHSKALQAVIAGLPEDTELRFIGHSMGNIVVRFTLAELEERNDDATLQRCQAIVMLGPPNQGSSIARLLSKTGVFGLLLGKGAKQLGADWKEIESRLAVPHCPFGIIAGRLPDSIPDNPLVDGKGDFIVSVEETRLEGSADFMQVPRSHTFLMNDATVHNACKQFFTTSQFE